MPGSISRDHDRGNVGGLLWAMPKRVPRTLGLGDTTGNMLGGNGTRGPEKAPTQISTYQRPQSIAYRKMRRKPEILGRF